jgi:hypothetical protein
MGPRLGTKPESVDAQMGTMLDIFARGLKKKIAQVCTLLRLCACLRRNFYQMPSLQHICNRITIPKAHWNATTSYYMANNLLKPFLMYIYVCQNYSCNNMCLFFRRLKINHEFILESGTVVNINDHKISFDLSN